MRAFLAIPLPKELEESFGSLQNNLRDLSTLSQFRWILPKNVHLTLRFFEEIDERQAEAAGTALTGAAAMVEPFELHFDRLGTFPSLKKPNVLWVGPKKTPETLSKLADAISEELLMAGFPSEERTFHPHLTLARRRVKGVAPPGLEGELKAAEGRWLRAPIVLSVTEAVLFQSELTPEGAIHTPLYRAAIGEVK